MYLKRVIEKVNKPDFQNNLWTLLASGVTSVFSAVMLLLTVRIAGLAAAGFLGFAIAVATLLYIVVMFGVRPVQAVDVKHEFSLNSYLGLRLCTAALATVAIFIFVLAGRFEMDRVIVIISFFFIYLTDGVADVFMGNLQQNSKMRIAGRMRVCAFISALVAFSAAIYITRSLIIALIVTDVVILAVYIVFIWYCRMHFQWVCVKFDIAAIKALAFSTLPLLLSWFVASYLGNAQKYFLGFLHSDETVAIVSILIMPTVAFNLLCNSFFNGAEVTKTAQIYSAGTINDLARRIRYQLLIMAGLAAIFLLCCFTFGIPLLSWIYRTDLSSYKLEFTFIILGGTLNGGIAAYSVALLLLRLMNKILFVVVAIAVISVPVMLFLVTQHGIAGAAFSHFVIFVAYASVSYMIYHIEVKNIREGIVK